MKRNTKLSILLIAVLLVSVSALGAQNLLKENSYYQEAQKLKRQAQDALEAGEYDRATELSQEAQGLMEKAESYAEQQLRIYRARGWKNRAEDYVLWAKGVGAEERYPDKWKEASTAFGEAESLFEEEQWEESISSSKETIALIEEIEPRSDVKPRYYTVRDYTKTKDCFWNIAGYDFVYGNPWKWKVLYEANKEKLPQPDNPSLVHPGTKLRIPSISGEQRGGTWEPKSR